MTGPRIFLVVLALFAVLFIVGLSMGLRQNDSPPDPHNLNPPDWTNSLSDWFSPTLDLNTVQGACVQAAPKTFAVASGSSCKLQVPSSTQKYRKAKLHLIAGASVNLTYKSPTTDDPNLSQQELSWPGKDPQSLVVLAGGGTVTISCSAQAPCQLQEQ
jgi:hypothetical protein